MEQTRKPVHPGKVFLQDVLVPLGVSITNAAQKLGISRKALSGLVNEKSSCTAQMALRIAKFTNTSAESWLIMQIKLDLWKIRHNTITAKTEKAFI